MGHSGSGGQGEPGIREAGISEQLRVGLGIALSNHVGSGGQKASISEVASVAEVTSVGGNRGDSGGSLMPASLMPGSPCPPLPLWPMSLS